MDRKAIFGAFLGSALLASCGLALALSLAHARRVPPAPTEGSASTAAVVVEVPAAFRQARASASAPVATPAPAPMDDTPPRTLEEQRRALFHAIATELDLSEPQRAAVEAIIEASAYVGQGNPAISRRGLSRAECRAARAAAGLVEGPHPPCGRRNMVPVFDPEHGETAADARLCIDQFEFPDIPCEYPVVYASAREAALLCRAAGKRLCDAHEWEGACAGALRPPEVEYDFGRPRPYATWRHNRDREVRWAYGAHKNHALCGTGMPKTPGCLGGGWTSCGSNTYPAGSFPACVSPFGVYDQHGNAAEHMSLPLKRDELGSLGGTGATEMKGSWFAFQREEPHEDDCRWRAKDWHPSAVMDVESHRNYHLGLRCCSDVPPDAAPGEQGDGG